MKYFVVAIFIIWDISVIFNFEWADIISSIIYQ